MDKTKESKRTFKLGKFIQSKDFNPIRLERAADLLLREYYKDKKMNDRKE